MKKFFPLVAVLLLGACAGGSSKGQEPLSPQDCYVFNQQAGTMTSWPRPVAVVIDPSNDVGFSEDQFMATIVGGVMTWDAEVAESPIRVLTEGTVVRDGRSHLGNGINEILIGPLENPIWVAVTYLRWVRGDWLEADIVFNERTLESTDLLSTAIHELGHFYGLDHVDKNQCPGHVMNPNIHLPDIGRVLKEGDVAGAQSLYGKP